MRWLALWLAFCLPALAAPARAQDNEDVFASKSVLHLTIKASFADLLARKAPDAPVRGEVLYRSADGREVEIDRVLVSVRGHTSREDTECTFPKLKLRLPRGDVLDHSIFAGMSAVKIGTHCGDDDTTGLTEKYGRLPREQAAHREAFVYRLLGLLGVPTLRTRPARITYVDTAEGAPPPITRDAFLLEDDSEALHRLHGTSLIPAERFTSASQDVAPADAVNLAFGEALIGNFDWCFKFTPADRYRCDARHPLWNLLAIARTGATVLPVMYDFDLSGMVTGPHPWFGTVFTAAFAGSKPAVEVDAQLQRTRTLFSRAELDAARRRFAPHKADAYRALDAAPVDDQGKRQIRSYLEPFFAAMERDDAFYLPVVVRPNTRASRDSAGVHPACARGAVVPVGTPVGPALAHEGRAMKVVLLDALWHWTGANKCEAIKQPVWIPNDTVSTAYPR